MRDNFGSTIAMALIAVAAGCGTEPVAPRQDPPLIEALYFESRMDYGVSPAEGFLEIIGWAADPAFRVSAGSEFPVEVRTSSGDTETVSLRKRLCGPDRDSRVWDCDRIAIGMRDGYSAADLYPQVKAIDARFSVVSVTGLGAGIQLFGMGLDDAVRRAKTWPGVKYAAYSYGGFAGGNPEETIARSVSAVIKLDRLPPIVRNGVLEAIEGDTITAQYVQPDSSILARDWVLPTPPWLQ